MNLEDIEKLCNKATPGPWFYKNCGTGIYIYSVHVQQLLDTQHLLLNTQHLPTRMEVRSAISEDMAFLAMARMMLPKLLAVAKAAKNVSKWGEFNEGCDGCWINNLDSALEELEKE